MSSSRRHSCGHGASGSQLRPVRIEQGACWEETTVPQRMTLNGRLVDRRTFLGALAMTAAGSAIRLTRAGLGSPVGVQGSSAAASAVAEGTGHVDDMWGHWPRYAQPIPCTLVHHVPISLETVAPADLMFVA
jgi:hypothetical protein